MKSQKGNTLLKSIITLIVTLLLGTTAWNGVQENASNDNYPNSNQTINTETNNNLDTEDAGTGDTSDSIQSNTSEDSSSSNNQITSEDSNSNDNQVTSEDTNSTDDQTTTEDNSSNDTQTSTTENKDTSEEEDSSSSEETTLTFRNQKLLNSHYEKHGKEMGFASAKEYEEAAARVVTNKEVLHKTEAEDGDDVYYIESTNEFVVVSKDGYLRTYFYPSDGLDYYNRQ